MLKLIFNLTAPLGMLILLIYTIFDRFIGIWPAQWTRPTMTVGIILLVIGIAYNLLFVTKLKNPFKFK